jgi:hypothetical protein
MNKDRTPEEFDAFLSKMAERNDIIKRELENFNFYIAMEDKAQARKHQEVANELVRAFERDFEEFMGVSVDEIIRLP